MVLTVPVVALPPVTPLTFHVTAVFEVFVTVAVNCLVRPMRTLALVGEIVTVTGGGGGFTIMTDALPIADDTALLVACTVTMAGEGTPEGAV